MNLKVLRGGGVINSPAKEGDAGFDVIAKSEPKVIGSIYQGLYYTAISHIEYDTEVRIEPDMQYSQLEPSGKYDFFMLLYPRSSIIKTNLILANSVGVIDSGYRGNIKACFKYVPQPEDMKIVEGKSFRGKNAKGIVASINPQRVYHEGDKIAQLIPCGHNDLLIEYVDALSISDRNKGGFGSTDL